MSTPSPEWWQKISPYLDEALGMGDDERANWLESLRAKDPALASHLESLLREHQVLSQEQFLEKRPLSILPAEATTAGMSLGAYTLVSLIGEGGMGSVWLAERSDGRFKGRAAVKVLRVPLFGHTGGERFKREGTILARLAHPHIAQLLDAGVSSGGQPYLILEYVEGKDIVAYCDERRLGVEARLRLFLDVLAAVAHAHSNLIVHRDIKPSNVFVRADGQVKLLDFGIAKLLENEGAEGGPTQLTREGGAALTPQYAAPEQVTGGPVTVATDVYAAGVLFYVLLTGQHPAGAGPHSPADLIKAIVDTETQSPSRVVAADGDYAKAAEMAADRSSSPDKLRRLLRGDLDTITTRTLKKNPLERYNSAVAFADDIRRYLSHEPISARPDTITYRAAKFLRRNRAAVALGATALALVIGSLSAGLLVANRERKIAERRFAQVRQLANKFIALDERIRGLPGSTNVRMQMVTDSLQYLTSLGSDVHGDKDMALDVALAYVRVAHAQGNPTSPNLGQFTEAEVSLGKAENFIQSVLKADPTNLRGLLLAATIAHDHMTIADEQNRRGDEAAWGDIAAERIERYMHLKKIDPHDIYPMAYFELNVAYSYDNSRHFQKAVRAGQRALEIMQLDASAHKAEGSILGALVVARWQTGDLDGALQAAQKVIKLQEAQAAGGHATLRVNLAEALRTEGMILGKQDAEPSLGRSREALADFQRGIDIGEELAKMDPLDYLSRHTVALQALEMGNILRHSDPQRALAVYDHALARVREVRPNLSNEIYAADLLAGSSYAARWTGRGNESHQRIEQAFQLLRDAHQYPAEAVEPMSVSDHVMRALADEYAETRQTARAITAYQELLDKLMAWKPDPQGDLRDATCISRTWTALAILKRRNGQVDEAARLEAQRAKLWVHWNAKLPNAQFLLRQSLNQISLGPTYPAASHQ